MPFVKITLVEGRADDDLRRLLSEVTQAVTRSLEIPIQSVRVVISEVPPTHWAAGDVTIAERELEGRDTTTVHAPIATSANEST